MYLHGIVEEHDAHTEHEEESGKVARNGPALFAESSCYSVLDLKFLGCGHDGLDNDKNVLQTQNYHKEWVHLTARWRKERK